MVKEVNLQVTVEEFSAKRYYGTIYQGERAFARFHAEGPNQDASAVVGPWEGFKREVKFNMPLNVPPVLKKVIGLEKIDVIETQEVKWVKPDEEFLVISTPTLNFPGSQKFMTTGEMRIATVGNTCQVNATIKCSTSMPWPLQTTVEAAMADEAVQSLRIFLDFCKQLCEEVKSGRAAPSEHEEDDFYDALEPSTPSQLQLVRPEPVRIEDIIVTCLRSIQQSTAETAMLLQKLEQSMQSMDENIAAMRAIVAPGRSHRTSRRGAWLCVLSLGVAGAAGAVYYMRHKHKAA